MSTISIKHDVDSDTGISVRKSGSFETNSGSSAADDDHFVVVTGVLPTRTDTRSVESGGYFVKADKERSKQHNLSLSVGRTSIDGAVLSFDSESALCELYGERGLVQIRLPRGLLPADIQYGAPISLSIDETSGVRRTVVRKRVITSSPQEHDRFSELLRDL